MKTLSFLLFTTLSITATSENPLIPGSWFQDLTATDGSTQQCIIFTTIAGVEYTFYHSNELEEWTEVGKTYGLGQQFSAAMRETAPAPPPPDPENPPPPGPVFLPASITIKPSSGTAGGTVVSWPSLDHGNAVQYLITGTMDTAWYSVPLFAENYGTHHFFISHTPGDTTPPGTNPILDTEDAAMIADLEAAWFTFNISVTTAQQTAINTPPPPPPAADSKGFWRIKADWSLDSDGDGSPDHLEFANAVAGPNGLVGNAFNADTDGNGIPDGKQLDKDDDGIPDADDAFNDNPDIAFKIISLPRYAMFEIPGRALQINDRGTVIFPWRVWKNGAITDIPAGHTARGINDSDEILGTADRISGEIEDGGELDGEVFVMTAPGGAPEFPSFLAPKKDAAGDPVAGGATVRARDFHDTQTTYGPAPLISNAGDFMAHGSVASGQLAVGEVLADETDTAYGQWRFGGNPARIGVDYITRHFFHGFGINHPAPSGSGATLPITYSWGWDYSKPAGENAFVSSDTGSLAALPIIPFNIIKQTITRNSGIIPSYIATFPEDGNGNFTPAKIHIGGAWKEFVNLGNAVDFSFNGTAVGRDLLEAKLPILLNGKWTAMDRYAPEVPENWLSGSSVRLRDTTPGGWVLAVDQPQAESAALLPLRFTGSYTDSSANVVDDAVGVDDFSIGSSNPDLSPLGPEVKPVRDRIWIMAPRGVAKTIRIHAPLHSTASLKISAQGVVFDGMPDTTLTSNGQTFTVQAAANSDTGAETDAILEIGTATSVSSPLAFKIMQKRIVNVTVYKIGETAQTSGGTVQLNADLVPEKLQLENFLNDFYEPQVNITFNVDIKPIQVEAPIDYEPDGMFTSGIGALTNDQYHVTLDAIDQAGPAAASTNITVYLLGTHMVINNNAAGSTNYGTRTCWVKSKIVNSAREEEELAQVMNTIAHEIGHVMIGYGHPSDVPRHEEEDPDARGYAQLINTKHWKRLMRAGRANAKGFDHLLVKAEWDEIEKWLVVNVDKETEP